MCWSPAVQKKENRNEGAWVPLFRTTDVKEDEREREIRAAIDEVGREPERKHIHTQSPLPDSGMKERCGNMGRKRKEHHRWILMEKEGRDREGGRESVPSHFVS